MRRSFVTRGAFVLRATDLEALAGIITRSHLTPKYSVRLRDGTSDGHDDLNGVLHLANSKRRAIRSIEVMGNVPDRWISRMRVTLDETYPEVEFDLEGDGAEVASWTEQLEEWATGLHPWYSQIAPIHWGTVATAVVWIMVVVELLLLFLPTPKGPESAARAEAAELVMTTATFPATIFVWTVYALKMALFPRGAFAFGQGERRYQQRMWLQRGLGGLVVAIAISLVANVVWVAATSAK